MLFIVERAAELAAIPSSELPPLCAIAPVPDSTRTVANVIIEAFIVDVSGRWTNQIILTAQALWPATKV
jgi:hypothetical protein